MRSIEVKLDQSLADIAIQEYGDISGLFFLVKDNPQLHGPTDNIYLGDLLSIRDEVVNKSMVDYLRPYEITTVKGSRGEGINYWAIEVDFVVQPTPENETTLFLSTDTTIRNRFRVQSEVDGIPEKIYVDWGDGTGEHEYAAGVWADYTYLLEYSGVIKVRPESNDIRNIYYLRSDDSFSQWNFELSALYGLTNLMHLILGLNGSTSVNKVTGSIDGLSSSLIELVIKGDSYITGDIASLDMGKDEYSVCSLLLVGQNMNLTYSTRNWFSVPGNAGVYTYFQLSLATGRLTETEIDQLLVDLSLTLSSGIASRPIYINGSNSAPTQIGSDAIAVLQSNGYTVIYNT